MSTAPEQLRRLLALLPEIGPSGKPIATIADRLGVAPESILRDLRDFSERLHDPPGWIDKIQLFIEADNISMTSPHFRRPMRLSADEWRAMELGLAMMRAERAPDDRPAVDAVLEKVRHLISQDPEGESTRAATLGAEKHTDALAALRSAMRDHRRVEITYQKADGDAPDRRAVCPFSFVVEQGVWYLVASCHAEQSEGSTVPAQVLRIFRLDRVLGLKVLNESFEPAPAVDMDTLLQDGRAFMGNPPERLRVRYTPGVAKWIAEREKGTTNADGTFEAEYPLGDASWAMRHVLQYGPEAEVISPPEVRAAVIARLNELVV